MSIFKAYDIRGIYPQELNQEISSKIAISLVKLFKKRRWKINPILICYDKRISSSVLFNGLKKGFSEFKGMKILNYGACSTPFFYWLSLKNKVGLGIMITASHNPPEFNGFKILREGNIPLAEKEIKEIEKIFYQINLPLEKKEKFKILVERKKASLRKYLQELIGKSGLDLSSLSKRNFKLVADCGNGMIGPELEILKKFLPLKLEILFGKPDGRFPNHLANPLDEKTLKDIKKFLKTQKFDFGIAFDGDGDRVIFLDQDGRVVRGDIITALIARDYLIKEPSRKKLKIGFEIRSSMIVEETIVRYGGIPILLRAGHSLIKEAMRKENIIFAGELSGHYFYKELGTVDNAIFTILKILKIFSESGESFSSLVSPFQKYYQSGEINFKIREKFSKQEVLNFVEKEFLKSKITPKKVLKLDGISLYWNDWWFNLRPSNTENLLRLNIEARDKTILEKKKEKIVGLIKKFSL